MEPSRLSTTEDALPTGEAGLPPSATLNGYHLYTGPLPLQYDGVNQLISEGYVIILLGSLMPQAWLKQDWKTWLRLIRDMHSAPCFIIKPAQPGSTPELCVVETACPTSYDNRSGLVAVLLATIRGFHIQYEVMNDGVKNLLRACPGQSICRVSATTSASKGPLSFELNHHIINYVTSPPSVQATILTSWLPAQTVQVPITFTELVPQPHEEPDTIYASVMMAPLQYSYQPTDTVLGVKGVRLAEAFVNIPIRLSPHEPSLNYRPCDSASAFAPDFWASLSPDSQSGCQVA